MLFVGLLFGCRTVVCLGTLGVSLFVCWSVFVGWFCWLVLVCWFVLLVLVYLFVGLFWWLHC